MEKETKEVVRRPKRRLKKQGLVMVLILVAAIVGAGYLVYQFGGNLIIGKNEVRYLASATPKTMVYDKDGKELEQVVRGTKVTYQEKENIKIGDETFYLVKVDAKEFYVKKEQLEAKKENVVLEKSVYVRTPQNLYSMDSDGKLLDLVQKGDELTVEGYDTLLEGGNVTSYVVKVKETKGRIYSKYVVFDKESALANYEPDKYYEVHANRGDRYGGGDAGHLDYFPVDKPKFTDNVMPEKVYALYLNAGSNVIGNVDAYIELAKQSKINAFVVDIKDVASSGYASPVMQKYSPTNYEKAINSFEDYQKAIKKIKDAGFYVIGRIVVFNDPYYAQDHPENTIRDTRTDKPFYHGSYWPSAFQRPVWEFNVALAKEAVKEMGFHEIQFDYVRFPDRTGTYEKQGIMDFRNTYQEEKAQAVQRFVQYATDEIHKLGAYVSADVFGESAHTYVTAYGQYWAAISNVVDAISGMPYPDHFSTYEYGFKQPVWTVPYDLLNYWGSAYVAKRQTECPTPAIVRTWIQAYDTSKNPSTVYGPKEVEAQIKGLFDAGLTGGYMTWNSRSSLEKYKSQLPAYSKEYGS